MRVSIRFIYSFLSLLLAVAPLVKVQAEVEVEVDYWGEQTIVDKLVDRISLGDVANTVFYPISLSFRVVKSIVKDESMEIDLQEEGVYASGYVFSYMLKDKLVNKYLVMNTDDFYRKIDEVAGDQTKKPLFILRAKKDSILNIATKQMFDRKYGELKGAKYIVEPNPNKLMELLHELPQNGGHDRIELFGHGEKGTLLFGNGMSVDQENVQAFINSKFNFAKAGAQLRVTSCTLGANSTFCSRGDELTKGLGRAFIPKGGKVFSNQLTLDMTYYRVANGGGKKNKIKAALKKLKNMIVKDIKNNTLIFTHLDSNYLQLRKPITQVHLISAADDDCMSAILTRLMVK